MSATLRHTMRLAALAAAVLTLAAAPAAAQRGPDGGRRWDAGPGGAFFALVDRLRDEAVALERDLELHKALLRWRYIVRLRPDDREARARVAVLREQTRRLAREHFENGARLYRNGKTAAARREFLVALSYDPEHREAHENLRARLQRKDWVHYTVVEGDTLETVAEKAYTDPNKDFLVAAFNNLGETADLEPGLVLKLPVLGADLRRPAVDIEAELSAARGLIEQQRYEQAVQKAERVLLYDSTNGEAREVIDAAYYRKARHHARQGELLAAREAYKQVRETYRDAEEAVSRLRERLDARAEALYKAGLNHFIAEELDAAIEAWEEALRYDPDHARARKDLENARDLRARLEQVR